MYKTCVAGLKKGSASLKEYLELIGINCVVWVKNFIEFIRVAFHYYRNLTFCKLDLSLLLTYLFHNPFTISKEYLQRKGEKEIYAYGETPLTTLDHIAKECRISKNDTVFELGSGRGRACFWLNSFLGCKVVGIERIPEFVQRADQIKSRFDVTGVTFRQQDLLDVDYAGATVIYLYGTCMEAAFIEKLISKLRSLPAGTKVITVSYALTDYTSQPLFEVMRCFPAHYPWGTADVFLQIKK